MGATQFQRLYNRARWKKMSRQQRQRQPLCAMCKARGIIAVAQVADHIRQHRGNEAFFYDPANLQSLCRRCHDTHKARAERSGRTWSRAVGPDGWPTDPAHPANVPRPWRPKAGKP
jgi:5-methylcytosine-specific restriction endonuclease McrA